MAADAGEIPFLEKPQKLGLQFQLQVGYLIQKHTAAVGEFKLADIAAVCTGKCALFVTEEFIFNQF